MSNFGNYSIFLSQKTKHQSSFKFYRAITQLFAVMAWMLVFFVGFININPANSRSLKITKSITAPAAQKSTLPDGSSNPLQLPEESDFVITGLDDEVDNAKKMGLTIFLIHFFGFKHTIEIQTVRSFHYQQAIQQLVEIPLFVLHHSWKSYLD